MTPIERARAVIDGKTFPTDDYVRVRAEDLAYLIEIAERVENAPVGTVSNHMRYQNGEQLVYVDEITAGPDVELYGIVRLVAEGEGE